MIIKGDIFKGIKPWDHFGRFSADLLSRMNSHRRGVTADTSTDLNTSKSYYSCSVS
jgi:hypothetical protein